MTHTNRGGSMSKDDVVIVACRIPRTLRRDLAISLAQREMRLNVWMQQQIETWLHQTRKAEAEEKFAEEVVTT